MKQVNHLKLPYH